MSCPLFYPHAVQSGRLYTYRVWSIWRRIRPLRCRAGGMRIVRSCALGVAIIGLMAAGDVVAPTITVSPGLLVFSASTVAPNPPPQSTTITNTGSGAASWAASQPGARWLSVTPNAGTAPGTLQVKANATGLRPGTYADTLYMQQTNDTTRLPVVVVLKVSPPPPAVPSPGVWASYEVEVEFVGYTGLIDAAPDCKVDTQGYDRLTGTMTGFEPTAADEDVIYTGTLARTTLIDYCETRKAPTEDERDYCVVSLVGFGVTDVEITVSGEDGRGAYMKAAAAHGPRQSSVRASDCDAQETNQARSDYHVASDLGAASPNGQPIDDINATDNNNRPITFAVSGHARLRVGTYPPDGPQGGWTLKVIRKIP